MRDTSQRSTEIEIACYDWPRYRANVSSSATDLPTHVMTTQYISYRDQPNITSTKPTQFHVAGAYLGTTD
jgi:hypothetical protein